MGRSPGRRRNVTCHSLFTLLVASVLGCAAKPYCADAPLCTQADLPLNPDEPQIERGRPLPLVDTVGWVVGVPSKILMLDRHVNDHDVSPETEARIKEYLAANHLDKVKVRLNQYDPMDEWHRLLHNQSVGWPLRYTFGTVTTLGYTLLPGRIFGGDQYNPYTNSISLYSDVPAIALYEGGYAKDYAQTEHKGLYAVSSIVPGVGLFCQDAHASADALGYLKEHGTPEDVKEGYRAICPVYAATATGPFETVTGLPVVLPAVAVGHVVGQVEASSVAGKQPASCGQ